METVFAVIGVIAVVIVIIYSFSNNVSSNNKSPSYAGNYHAAKSDMKNILHEVAVQMIREQGISVINYPNPSTRRIKVTNTLEMLKKISNNKKHGLSIKYNLPVFTIEKMTDEVFHELYNEMVNSIRQ